MDINLVCNSEMAKTATELSKGVNNSNITAKENKCNTGTAAQNKTISTRKLSRVRRPSKVNPKTDENTEKGDENAEAYTRALENHKSLNGTGTTVVGLIGHDAIYLGADTLSVSGEQGDHDIILSGFHQKIYEVNGHVYSSMAGGAQVCTDLLLKVIDEAGIEDSIYSVKALCERYIEEQEKKGKEFDSTIGLYGWEGDEAVMILVGFRKKIAKGLGTVMASGAGSVLAEKYLRSQEWRANFSKGEYTDLIRQSITFSGLHSSSTGGRVQVVRLSRQGDVEGFVSHDHIIRCLSLYYQQLNTFQDHEVGGFSSMLVLMTRNLEYTRENEGRVMYELWRQLRDIRDARVIGVSHVKPWKGLLGMVLLTYRILEFTDIRAAHQAFLKGIEIPNAKAKLLRFRQEVIEKMALDFSSNEMIVY